MNKSVCCPPVLFLIFNRPALTQQVFERIRQAGPPQLYIAADGPRPNVPADQTLCVQARQVADQVDWECEVHTLFRENNLGCKQAVSSAIDWFFQHVEAGIILEDDCVAHLTFFRFCAELLEHYCDDERVMVISGDNFQQGRQRTPYSYYFSRYAHIWGWASWRRAWRRYDGDLERWPALRDTSWLLDTLADEAAASYWRNIFDHVHAGEIDSWDYPWTFSCWAKSGLTILPEINLVSNIGFGDGATHTKGAEGKAANLPAAAMQFPIRHPPNVRHHPAADQFTFLAHYQSAPAFPKALFGRIVRKLRVKLKSSMKKQRTRVGSRGSHLLNRNQ